MTVVWSIPTRVLFGEGALTELGDEARRLGASSALLVADHEGPPGEDVARVLERAGVPATAAPPVPANPRAAAVHAAADAYREAHADLVVAVGGSGAMNAGKLVRLAVSHGLPLAEYDEAQGGTAKVTQPMPPMAALPTAGAGQEVTPRTLLTLDDRPGRVAIEAPALMPDVAILDPALASGLDPRSTAARGVETLAIQVEAYCAKADHPVADALALHGLELLAKHLRTAVEDGSDLRARGGLQKAALMAGVASGKGLGASHALAHPLSAASGIEPGEAAALCLPAVLDFNRAAATFRIARVARLLGVKGTDLDTLAFECSGKVRALRRDLGLDRDSVDLESLPDPAVLAAEAYADAAHRTNPRACTRDDLQTLLKASLDEPA
ncbi:MAG: iron-containing alcohol dehydrogenase [Sandaracinaceae bacterium]